MAIENEKVNIIEAFTNSSEGENNKFEDNIYQNSSSVLFKDENIDDYHKNIFAILIMILDNSLAIGKIDGLEQDIKDVLERYNRSSCNSKTVNMKLQQAQYVLMCKYLEAKNFEKAKTLCEKFDETMVDYICERVKLEIPNVVEYGNYYAAMLKIDISERINVDVNSLKFWEGILNIEKPAMNYRLPKEWQPERMGLIVKQDGAIRLSRNYTSRFGFVKVFKIRYDPKSDKNKMNLGDVQKLREYLSRPKVIRHIRIIFDEGIENVYLDLNNVNVLCDYSIKLPSTARSFGGSLFTNNMNISFVDMSNTQIERIDENSFVNSNIKKIKMPEALKVIGSNAFANCKELKKVDLSYSNIEHINKNAFYNSGIKKIKLASNLSSVDLEAFSGCEYLTNIDLSLTQIENVESGIVSKSGIKKIRLPDNIREINFGAFSDCKNLKVVDLSNTQLKRIGAYAFFNSNVEKIILPSTVETVEYEAFARCKNLRKVDFSKTKLKKVAPYAFYNSSVDEVKIPERIIDISENSFLGCKNVKEVKNRI